MASRAARITAAVVGGGRARGRGGGVRVSERARGGCSASAKTHGPRRCAQVYSHLGVDASARFRQDGGVVWRLFFEFLHRRPRLGDQAGRNEVREARRGKLPAACGQAQILADRDSEGRPGRCCGVAETRAPWRRAGPRPVRGGARRLGPTPGYAGLRGLKPRGGSSLSEGGGNAAPVGVRIRPGAKAWKPSLICSRSGVLQPHGAEATGNGRQGRCR